MDEYVAAADGSESADVSENIVIDDTVLTIDPVESNPVEFVDVVLADDVPPDAQTFGGPAIDGYDPALDMFDGFLEGTVDTSADVGTTPADPAASGPDETPGRPVDPQPEWRTLTSEDGTGDAATGDAGTTDGTADGSVGTVGDVPPEWAYTDFVPILDKDAGGDTSSDTPPDVYTMNAGPVSHAAIDPAFLTPVTVEADIDPTPVHSAPADSFGTGLDLL